MRFASVKHGESLLLVAAAGNEVRNLTALGQPAYRSLKALLAASGDMRSRVAEDIQRAPQIDTSELQFLPVVPAPTKVLCVGRNYAEHAIEQNAEVPDEPLIFAKAPSALIGHEADVRLPELSQQVDYEAELVVVIGARAHRVPRERAWEHVAGYCCGNDVTARDWQKGKPGKQWLLGKSFDTFAPVGPWLVTADEVLEPGKLQIRMLLNGTAVQSACTDHMLYPVDFLISYISQVMTLEPGDLLFTGTPSGVGFAQEPPRFLTAGDEMAVEIDGIGRLVNRVI